MFEVAHDQKLHARAVKKRSSSSYSVDFFISFQHLISKQHIAIGIIIIALIANYCADLCKSV